MKRTYIKPSMKFVQCFPTKHFLAGSVNAQSNIGVDGDETGTGINDTDEPDPDKPFGSARWGNDYE